MASYHGVVLPEGLEAEDVSRYSRQMLVHDIGGAGQARIAKARVLVVGAGGLGCAVIPSLAGAGIGTLGILDPDTVDSSNLHRQTMHRDEDAELLTNKAESAARFVRALNPRVSLEVQNGALEADTALALVRRYDLVVDCSDNPRTRYLVSDACVLAATPLVSGSAIGLEGQLSVYNYAPPITGDANEGDAKGGDSPRRGPCYRCAYPNPSAGGGGAASCAESGVVGPVPAVIGHLQALEALKIVAGFGEVLSGKLLMYDARSCSFHKFKLPARRPTCLACGDSPTVTSMRASAAFCQAHALRGVDSAPCRAGGVPCEKTLAPPPETAPETGSAPALPAIEGGPQLAPSVSASEYSKVRESGVAHLLLDVRDKTQFGMCALTGALNVPVMTLDQFRTHPSAPLT